MKTLGRICVILLGMSLGTPIFAADSAGTAASVRLPLDRTAYFLGEKVPLAVTGAGPDADVKLELINSDARTLLYQGRPAALWLDTSRLEPGDYQVQLNGSAVIDRLTLVSTLRKSSGSMQDEATPAGPQFGGEQQKMTPAERQALVAKHWDDVTQTMKESGLTAAVALGAAEMGRADYLDAMTRAGMLLLVNPDTRPTSFLPVGNMTEEQDSMSQRMILTAQANGRYPSFGGFCYGWDTTGYAVNNRRMLMTYWSWGDKTEALRHYIAKVNDSMTSEFTRRTGMQAVTEAEYLSYTLSIGHPEFAPVIDLPTRTWVQEMAKFIKPMPESDRGEFEKRLDAWSNFQMGLYAEAYGAYSHNLRGVDPELRETASVQVDHTAVRYGQYFPSAYAPLDLTYQTTWNDQVGGPDYAFQWLFTAGLLDMNRRGKPTWISNAMASAHGRADIPGKMARSAAADLAWGGSGIGFACEGFSNILGGMNKETTWGAIKGTFAEQDVRSGRDFLDRFACLATEARGDHGVGILFSKTQFARQHTVMGFGTPAYQVLITLTRLGFTPRFVTEEELAAGEGIKDVRALVVIGQTFELPAPVMARIAAFQKNGGRVLTDGNTSVKFPDSEPLGATFPFTTLGKPHSWGAPNMPPGENDTTLYQRWYSEIGPRLYRSFAENCRGLFTSDLGGSAQMTLTQIDGGADAKYIVAVNDSHVKTQADWREVREKMIPTPQAKTDSIVYDCTAEKMIGPMGPMACDLSGTTAKVFAVLNRPLKATDLSATQKIGAGDNLVFRVRFLDADGKPLIGVLPFHIDIKRPDGKLYQEFYRSTDAAGTFTMSLPIGVNAPAGDWTLAARSQLNGDVTTLPVTVTAAAAAPLASASIDPVVTRGRPAIDRALARGGNVVLPIFDSADAAALLPVAEKIKKALANAGVHVEIRQNPKLSTYWLAYEATDDQLKENALADSGETIGRIKMLTVNGNDWFCSQSGFRCGKPLILLNLAHEPVDPSVTTVRKAGPKTGASTEFALDPMVDTLAKTGILWPLASKDFPGAGRAIVQGIDWAFAPRVDAIVIQAADIQGLTTAADSLDHLPADPLTAGITQSRQQLWRAYNVGAKPAPAPAAGLTSAGKATASGPMPFAIKLDHNPPPADPTPANPDPIVIEAVPVPAVLEPKQFSTQMRDNGKWVEAPTASFLVPDLRFSQSIVLVVDVKQAGKVRITADGSFRYSDREPCSQAQWEDVLKLYRATVPHDRKPMHFDVEVAGKPAGTLLPSSKAQTEVPLEMAASSAGMKPRSVTEEAVVQLAGDIDLPAGRQEIRLIHQNIVDGKLKKVYVGIAPAAE